MAGVDEVGRGCLAGPVVAAAVIFPPGTALEGVADSKQLSPARREALFPVITRHAVSVAVGQVGPSEIDAINILRASLQAMQIAVTGLAVCPQHLLVDGRDAIPLALPQTPIIKGDQRSLTIAAASIIAKVTRDRLMVALDQQYPGYDLAAHKGYGTARHVAALRALGPSPIHRRSFAWR